MFGFLIVFDEPTKLIGPFTPKPFPKPMADPEPSSLPDAAELRGLDVFSVPANAGWLEKARKQSKRTPETCLLPLNIRITTR